MLTRWHNAAATEAHCKAQALEMNLRWWFPERHIFTGHPKATVSSVRTDPRRENGKLTADSYIRRRSTAVLLLSEVLFSQNETCYVRAPRENLYSVITGQHNLGVSTSPLQTHETGLRLKSLCRFHFWSHFRGDTHSRRRSIIFEVEPHQSQPRKSRILKYLTGSDPSRQCAL